MNILKIKKSWIREKILFSSLVIFLLSPVISNTLGIIRLDTVLSFFYVSIGIIYCCKIKNRVVKLLGIVLIGIFVLGMISTLLHFSIEKIVDLFFWGILIYLFIYLFIYLNDSSQRVNQERFESEYNFHIFIFKEKIKKIVLLFSIIIISAFLFEVFLGKQLIVGSNSDLDILGGAFKGLFFNTNDQAVICMSLSSIIAFFFILEQKNNRFIILYWILLSFLGIIIVISASRATLLSFIIMLMLLIFLNIRLFIFKIVYCILIGGGGIILYADWLKVFLDFLSNKIDWLGLNRAIERISLAIFNLDSDNSIGYRTEIYDTFFKNFKLIWLGYGPRDYIYFFDKVSLSYELGYTNPHSLFIEVYLAFGFLGFFLFLFFILYIAWHILVSNTLSFNQRVFSFFIILNFCWLVWVPSSVFRLPLIWLPMFLILIFSITSKRYKC